MLGYVDGFNPTPDLLLRDKSENAADPRMEKRVQLIAWLIQAEREGPKENKDWNLRESVEVMLDCTVDILTRKRNTLQISFKFFSDSDSISHWSEYNIKSSTVWSQSKQAQKPVGGHLKKKKINCMSLDAEKVDP